MHVSHADGFFGFAYEICWKLGTGGPCVCPSVCLLVTAGQCRQFLNSTVTGAFCICPPSLPDEDKITFLCELPFVPLNIFYVCCCNQTPWTAWLEQQMFIFSWFRSCTPVVRELVSCVSGEVFFPLADSNLCVLL